MYILLSVFLIVLLTATAFIVFAGRLLAIAGDIENAFERNGADLLTVIRIGYYSSVAETNPDSIDRDINRVENAAYQDELLDSFVRSFSDSLGCTRSGGASPLLTKSDRNDIPIYTIDRFKFTYNGSICTIRANLTIPIRFGAGSFRDYRKQLEYSFALQYK